MASFSEGKETDGKAKRRRGPASMPQAHAILVEGEGFHPDLEEKMGRYGWKVDVQKRARQPVRKRRSQASVKKRKKVFTPRERKLTTSQKKRVGLRIGKVVRLAIGEGSQKSMKKTRLVGKNSDPSCFKGERVS